MATSHYAARWPAVLGAVVALAMVPGCASRIGLREATTTTAGTRSTTSTTTKATTTTTTTTTQPPAAPTPVPGSACVLGSDPNCIDPEGDGQGVYLLEGAACIATLPPELCADLDGDGVAGYPDSG